MHLPALKKKDPNAPKPPIRYHDKMRQWTPGTWPYPHSTLDDGSDDNEVVDIMHNVNHI